MFIVGIDMADTDGQDTHIRQRSYSLLWASIHHIHKE